MASKGPGRAQPQPTCRQAELKGRESSWARPEDCEGVTPGHVLHQPARHTNGLAIESLDFLRLLCLIVSGTVVLRAEDKFTLSNGGLLA